MGRFLCARPGTKHCIYILSFNPHSNHNHPCFTGELTEAPGETDLPKDTQSDSRASPDPTTTSTGCGRGAGEKGEQSFREEVIPERDCTGPAGEASATLLLAPSKDVFPSPTRIDMHFPLQSS